jgi:5'-3' exonuclease
MGIRNLKVILLQKCKNAISTRKLESYRGMRLGIDLSIFLYKYLYNNGDHIEGLTRLILRLLKNQITPVFILDGAPPKEKDLVLQERKEKKEFLYIKKDIITSCIENKIKNNEIHIENNLDNFIINIKNIILKNKNDIFELSEEEMKDLFEKDIDELENDLEKIKKKIIHVSSYHIESSKKLFNLFGIKYIHEECEAESLLAVLCRNNVVDGCISEDSDILANGGNLFLKNFNADKNTVDEYCLHGILSNLNLNQEQFTDMCILCGCDYTTKIIGIGPMNAYKLILKYGNIENILENNTKYIIPENFNYNKARELFKNPISEEMYNKIDKDIKLKLPELNEINEFLKGSKLKDKYLIEINNNLINYYLNIDGIYQFDNNKIDALENIKKKNKKKNIINDNKKITDFFKN